MSGHWESIASPSTNRSVGVNQDGGKGWTQSSDVVEGDLSIQRVECTACISQKYSFILI